MPDEDHHCSRCGLPDPERNHLMNPLGCVADLKRENAKLREHVVNLLPYAHLLSRGEKPIAAYADGLPYIIADAETALKS